jgi:cell division septation protein DedD
LQDQLKERLTGAAILVVVVVFAVPEMFHGRPPAPAGEATAGTAAIPLRTYTMDLRSDPGAQPKRTDEGGDAPAPVDPAPLVPLPQSEVPALDAAPQQATPTGVTTGVIQRPAETLQPKIEAKPEPKVEPRPEPKAPAKVDRKPDKAPEKAAGSGWAVQVGSFRSKELAEKMLRQVRVKGFAVQMVGPDAKGLYRVRSALLPERAAAVALRERMAEKGYKPIINASP